MNQYSTRIDAGLTDCTTSSRVFCYTTPHYPGPHLVPRILLLASSTFADTACLRSSPCSGRRSSAALGRTLTLSQQCQGKRQMPSAKRRGEVERKRAGVVVRSGGELQNNGGLPPMCPISRLYYVITVGRVTPEHVTSAARRHRTHSIFPTINASLSPIQAGSLEGNRRNYHGSDARVTLAGDFVSWADSHVQQSRAH